MTIVPSRFGVAFDVSNKPNTFPSLHQAGVSVSRFSIFAEVYIHVDQDGKIYLLKDVHEKAQGSCALYRRALARAVFLNITSSVIFCGSDLTSGSTSAKVQLGHVSSKVTVLSAVL